MSLCIPIIKGPLCEWSSDLLVEGCIPGATIELESVGLRPRKLAKAIANGGSDRVPLPSGVQLEPGDLVSVAQQLGAEDSGLTPHLLAVSVGPAPKQHAPLAAVNFRSRVWECGARLWVKGAVPGALVVVEGPSGILGEARANENGDARIGLAQPMPPPGNTITARQDAPPGFPPLSGTPKRTAKTVDALPVHAGQQLPVPLLIGDPPQGCDGSMVIGGIFDGAQVSVRFVADDSTEASTFDLERLRFLFDEPLTGGDDLEVVQAMPGCLEMRPSDPLKVAVGPMQKPNIPRIAVPPCKDSMDIYVDHLLPGALVTVKVKEEEFRAMVPPTATAFTFRVTRLPGTTTITVRQERCGVSSDEASVQSLEEHAAGGPADLVDDLFSCGQVVRAEARPGSWMQVWAEGISGIRPISGHVFAREASMRIAVAPSLQEKDDVWVATLACGAVQWKAGARRHPVLATPDVGPVLITAPVVEGDR